jgi:hypothetical protein
MMAERTDRAESQRRLDQSRRLVAEPSDPLTKERLNQLVRDLEEKLRLKPRPSYLREMSASGQKQNPNPSHVATVIISRPPLSAIFGLIQRSKNPPANPRLLANRGHQ